jgi:hypothetical protein
MIIMTCLIFQAKVDNIATNKCACASLNSTK